MPSCILPSTHLPGSVYSRGPASAAPLPTTRTQPASVAILAVAMPGPDAARRAFGADSGDGTRGDARHHRDHHFPHPLGRAFSPSRRGPLPALASEGRRIATGRGVSG